MRHLRTRASHTLLLSSSPQLFCAAFRAYLDAQPIPCHSWNPACSDTINSVAYYINLLQGSMGTEIQRRNRFNPDAYSTCNGGCRDPEKPICRASGQCDAPNCNDVEPYCQEGSIVGLRARQICPVTCGCDQPQSTLALFLPESGCPDRCKESTNFRTALATIPCEDVAIDDPGFVGFLQHWHDVADNWPKDWKASGQVFIDLFQRFGCAYLNMNGIPENYTMPASQPLFWPANFGVGVNPCVTNGYYYPVQANLLFLPRVLRLSRRRRRLPGHLSGALR